MPGIFGVGALVWDRSRLDRPLGFEHARFAVSDLDGFDARGRLFDRDRSSADIFACACSASVRASDESATAYSGERECGAKRFSENEHRKREGD